MKTRLLALTILALVLVPSCAAAATWQQVTAEGGSSIDQVALLRTADGVLHVAWHHQTGPNTEDLLHTTIDAAGKVGATSPIQSGWASLENAALVAAPGGGIRVFFGGIRSTDPLETNQELNTALSLDGGATWVLQPGSVVPIGQQSYGSPVAATTLPDGTPLQAWAGTLGTWAHGGLTEVTPNHDFQAPLGNYGYDTGLATDSTGAAFLAWYSNASAHLGVFAQGVAADGSPIGSAQNMPDTSDMAVGQLTRTPIVARAGGGVYIAYATGYPTQNRIRLWKVGSSATALVASTHGNNGIATVAAGPDGRLWVAWKDAVGGKPHLFARRTNKAATAFGATVDGRYPAGAGSLYSVDASVSGESLDAFGAFSIGTSSTVSTYVTRLLPGLTISTKTKSLTRGKDKDVVFTVLDAGEPVTGAKVKGGGDSEPTSTRGRATLDLTGGSKGPTITATAKGYAPASVKLKVRK